MSNNIFFDFTEFRRFNGGEENEIHYGYRISDSYGSVFYDPFDSKQEVIDHIEKQGGILKVIQSHEEFQGIEADREEVIKGFYINGIFHTWEEIENL